MHAVNHLLPQSILIACYIHIYVNGYTYLRIYMLNHDQVHKITLIIATYTLTFNRYTVCTYLYTYSYYITTSYLLYIELLYVCN